MENKLILDQTFLKINFIDKIKPKEEYENCKFINCNFAEANLLDVVFMECTFEDCDLSLARLNETAFRDVKFIGCKMLGLKFDHCNAFGLSFQFEKCNLNHSSFYKIKAIKSIFIHCQLHEVDFTEANLTSSLFQSSDLFRAVFQHSILEKVDFTTAYNYLIDPEQNNIRKAKFSIDGIVGLLKKYDIQIY